MKNFNAVSHNRARLLDTALKFFFPVLQISSPDHLEFFIIAYSSHPLLLTEHAANGLVEAPVKLIKKMKDLLLCVHVVVKT